MNESMIIIFGNHEKVDTTKQSFRTTWLCKNIEFLDSFWFWISLINSNHRYIYVATYTHSYFILSRLQCFFFALYDEHFESDENMSVDFFLWTCFLFYQIFSFISSISFFFDCWMSWQLPCCFRILLLFLVHFLWLPCIRLSLH